MRIRNAVLEDAPALARVRVDAWRETYRGLIPDAYLDELSYAENESNFSNRIEAGERQGCCLVAEDEAGTLLGFAIGGIERSLNPEYMGEIYAIYLLKEYQRKGVGTALVKAVVQWLLDREMNSMTIWALEQNPARKFYEALGGTLIGTKPLVILDAHLTEVGYGWPDIRKLIQ
jgi:GNAT superfamily N-acetyltransferase